jgi:hypothetical protein
VIRPRNVLLQVNESACKLDQPFEKGVVGAGSPSQRSSRTSCAS